MQWMGKRVKTLKSFYRRLFPAAINTAGFAALAHAALVAIAARSIGLELIYIATLSFVVVLVVALLVGSALLLVVGVFNLKLGSSLLLFVIAIQAVAIGLEMHFFEIGLNDISWQYGLITAPASLIAWYCSVYHVWKSF